MGIEPTLSAWKAEVLPLNYTRTCFSVLCLLFILEWRGKDSNLRRQSRQIYSLIPLTAREPLQKNLALNFASGHHQCQPILSIFHKSYLNLAWLGATIKLS